MSRQPGFEKLYAKMHDIDPEDLVQYRFGSKDGYRLPQMASHYRLYCETLDSVEIDLKMLNVQHASYNNVDCYAIADIHKQIKAAGVKVKS